MTLATTATVAVGQDEASLIGRWDVTVQAPDGRTYPSWFEVARSGNKTLVGRYVGRVGSARPVAEVKWSDNSFRFVVPPQWERRDTDVTVSGRFDNGSDTLKGEVTADDGTPLLWTARRAPSLARDGVSTAFGTPVELFNGKNLDGWKPRNPKRPNGWKVIDGILTNAEPGNDLVTEATFGDFNLHAEFRYEAGSNSGIYLRGRYEAQLEDNFGDEPESHKIGAIYGFLTPSVNAAKKAGEWQSLDITLIGRQVTILLNGQRVVDNQAIPGPTGGALDSDESQPGPLFVQGDHGPVEFRKITLTPIVGAH
jgi:hypothetical protein